MGTPPRVPFPSNKVIWFCSCSVIVGACPSIPEVPHGFTSDGIMSPPEAIPTSMFLMVGDAGVTNLCDFGQKSSPKRSQSEACLSELLLFSSSLLWSVKRRRPLRVATKVITMPLLLKVVSLESACTHTVLLRPPQIQSKN